jgi:branched-chain amino acid aminotransferase
MIYLNGNFIDQDEAKIETNDRGFLLSDGIFETIRVYSGVISRLSDHYNRLKKSADFLNIPFVMSFNELNLALHTLLEKSDLKDKDASMRLTLTRGTGPRGLLPPEKVNPTVMITAFFFPETVHKPYKVMISQIKRNESSPLSNIKSLCYLDNIIARKQADEKGFNECIFLNTQGHVACGSVANIFIVTDKGIVTPRIEDGILPGITRSVVIKICEENNIRVFEQTILLSDLLTAKEVFFTNRLIEIQPVIQINEQLINDGNIGQMTTMLQTLYRNNLAYSESKDSLDEIFNLKCH